MAVACEQSAFVIFQASIGTPFLLRLAKIEIPSRKFIGLCRSSKITSKKY
jgi:hypothetical protein